MIRVLSAKPDNAEAMAELFQEMDEFYGETIRESFGAKVSQICSALFGDPPLAYALLAWDDSKIVGFAGYSFLWPAALTTKSLYLKELYVSVGHRRHGIGNKLMTEVFKLAAENKCSRVEWTTDQDNVEAQKFYEHLGVPILSSKVFYRAEGKVP